MPTALPARIAWAREYLDLSADAHVLESGSGAGHALGLIVARLATGTNMRIGRTHLLGVSAQLEDRSATSGSER